MAAPIYSSHDNYYDKIHFLSLLISFTCSFSVSLDWSSSSDCCGGSAYRSCLSSLSCLISLSCWSIRRLRASTFSLSPCWPSLIGCSVFLFNFWGLWSVVPPRSVYMYMVIHRKLLSTEVFVILQENDRCPILFPWSLSECCIAYVKHQCCNFSWINI